jgi:CPA1 family monovalent cation:H+ antiporter
MSSTLRVWLVLAGIGLYFRPGRLDIQRSKDLIFSVFLPPLIFEAALYIPWRELRTDLPVVGLLATIGVLIAAAITAAGMQPPIRGENRCSCSQL